MINDWRRPSIVALGVLALLFMCSRLTAQAQGGRPVTFDDLLSLKYPGDMDLSPDGQTLAYDIAEEDSLWLVNTNEGFPLKVGEGIMPRWSPDSARLAFYSRRSGALQLWVLDRKTSKATQLTSLKGGINPDPMVRFGGWTRDPLRYCWSPEGSKIVFTSRVKMAGTERLQVAQSGALRELNAAGDKESHSQGSPLVLTAGSPSDWALSGIFLADSVQTRHVNGELGSLESNVKFPLVLTNQLFTVDVANRKVEQVTKDDAGSFNPAWSPDGTKIIFASTEGRRLEGYGPGTSNIYAIDVEDGRKTALTTGPGEKRLPSLSPDGTRIAYLGGTHFGMQFVYILPSTGGNPTNITLRLDRHVYTFYWTSDSSSVLVSCQDGVSVPIVRVSVLTGKFRRLTEADAYHEPFTASRGGTVVWAQSDGLSHGVFYTSDSEGRNSRVLLDLNPQIKQLILGKQEVVGWKNSRGEEVEGILIKPAEYQEGKTYPVIIDPYPVRVNSFMAATMLANQAFASRGYAVFFPNERTPHTWEDPIKGEAYNLATRGPTGVDVMIDDLMTGIDTLVKRGVVDPERMCLYGFSNGAGAVNLLVTKTSRFRCAVSASGLADWALSFFLVDASTFSDLTGGITPWEDPNAYIKLSAVYHLDKVTTPMLLAVGDEEFPSVLPVLEMYYGLRYLGRDVTLLRYPKQGHGFTGTSLKDYWQRVNAFFDLHLKPSQVTK